MDTCVISEVIKPRPNENVLLWLRDQKEDNLFLSVLTFGEIEKGIEKTADESRRSKLKLWVEEDLKKRFEGRIISIDLNISTAWGTLQGTAELSGNPMPVIDGLVHNCIVVTRNTSDMEQSSAVLLDPWKGD